MKKRNMTNLRYKNTILCILVIAILTLVLYPFLNRAIHPTKYIASDHNLLSVTIPYIEENEVNEKHMTIPRGTKVQVEESDKEVSKIKYQGELIPIDNKHLVDDLEDCVQVDYIYPRRLVNLRSKKDGVLSNTIVKKGEKVKVLHVDPSDLDVNTGIIDWYQVEKNHKKYFIRGQYVETNKKLATKNYAENIQYSTYWDFYYGDSYSKDAYIDQVDYKPQTMHEYEDNPIKKDINSVHVNLEYLLANKDYYLNLAKETGINSLTVELKGDGGYLFYQSEVAEKYLKKPKEATANALLSIKELKKLFKEFQDQGFYMIARIVTFKDAIFAKQNPDHAITDKQGKLVAHNDEYWPSAYSRKAWMYNVDIAKELADCNVNEIQFDYVRFPDGTLSKTLDKQIDLHNTYNESKTAALQGFLMYAKEELIPYEVYVAADVFAWPVVAQDDQDIGQFLPAIANAVDVVSPMPYTDHFSKGAMGISDPELEPEETLYQFSDITKRALHSIEKPALYRTWIQGYGTFGPAQMEAQIHGINKAGYEGYLVWAGNGKPEILEPRKAGFINSALN